MKIFSRQSARFVKEFRRIARKSTMSTKLSQTIHHFCDNESLFDRKSLSFLIDVRRNTRNREEGNHFPVRIERIGNSLYA